MQRLNVEFRSEGVALRGWLYLPEARAERPAIVMTHGFSGVKEQYLDRYAEVFAAAGFVVLLYDHPNFGDSDGEPRQEIDPVMQRRGYRDAIAVGRPGPGRRQPHRHLGTSYSGGHVLEVAALDRRVKCVVAQVPTVSGHASALRRTRAEQLPALLASFDADRQRRFEACRQRCCRRSPRAPTSLARWPARTPTGSSPTARRWRRAGATG